MFNDIFKAVGPMVAAAMAAKAAEWDSGSGSRRKHGRRGFPFGDGPFKPGRFGFGEGGFHFEFDSDAEGMKLEDLDFMAAPPAKLMLFGPDRVTVSQGKTFRVKAEGPAAGELRFIQKEGTLGILRPSFERRSDEEGETVVTVTLPELCSLVIAGAGTVDADGLAANAKLTIAGSGAIAIEGIEAEKLKVNVLGSGRLTASGHVGRMKLNIAGSGMAEMAGLEAARAKVTVAGSGTASFASDGEVDAHIMGSGLVTVHGRAKCSVHSVGAGRLVCVPREDAPAGKTDGKPGKPSRPAQAKTAKTASKAGAKKAAAKAPKTAKPARKSAAKPASKPRKKG